MTAGERMSRSFEVIHPDVLLEHISSRFDLSDRRPILVCEHDRLIGVLDPEAIREDRWTRGIGAGGLRARDALAPDVLYCLESTELAEAEALMREYRVPAIPVLSADLRLVGIVALADVVEDGEPASAEREGDRAADRR